MPTTLIFLMLFPLAWPLIAKLIWKDGLCWKEIGINIVGVIVLVFAFYWLGTATQTSDREVWNGEVVSKSRDRVSCSHSYSCNCHLSGSGKNATTVCDTCYEHSYDVDWDVRTTIGNFSISRVDRQGLVEPPRWGIVEKGQPWADTHTFTNYIKAVPESVFHFDPNIINSAYTALVPPYPLQVYDYQYIDRVLARGVTIPDLKQWNYDLAMALRDLGPAKQANAIIVFVNTPNQEFYHALESAWLGGKKNDIIVIVGAPEYPKIEWVRVMSWTKEELFKVELRDDLQALGNADRTKFIQVIHDDTLKGFKRRQMKEFEYLKSEIEPPTWALVILTILAVGGSIGLTIVLKRTDMFEERW